MSKILIALGGNALGKTFNEQLELVKQTSKTIVELIKEGHEIIITHGNGPQVGMISLAMDYAYSNEVLSFAMPFAECGAMSEGYIGYHLQQSIQNELVKENINKKCVTVITQVLVDKNDNAFNNPTKPVGMFYTKEQADEISSLKNQVFVEDSNRGYRRVVPSPNPIEIIEFESINDLINSGNVVIAVGGGGIPVIKENNNLIGVDAVIDKDLSSSLLASQLNFDKLLILTNVSNVCINYNKDNEIKLSQLTIDEAINYINDDQFAVGSMLPKVKACLEFVEKTKHEAIITSLLSVKGALKNETGTLIKEK